MSACAIDASDLERWETTLGGPKRLSAVVLHDKYPLNLRVQAAMSLIRMKPRKGKHVGIDRFVKGALVCDPEFDRKEEPCKKAELSPDTRAKILADLIPLIIDELDKPPPPPAQKGQRAPDPSFVYKDAAYLMLTYEKTQVVTDQALRKRLEDALVKWAMADFERRLSDRTQAFGMEQLLRHIGPPAVRGLPAQMTKDSRNLAKMADLVAKIGSKETREEASKRLVDVIKWVSSDEWRKQKEPELVEANRKAQLDPTPEQFKEQLATYQTESIVRVFRSMKQVGGAAVVDYCLTVAADDKAESKARQTALAALEGHIDRKNAKHIERLFAVAKAEKAPPEVIDQAFRRIKEMPREQVIKDLYGFFSSKDWKLRRLAAATVLSMSTSKHIDEFLKKLNERATKNYNLPEAITYGAYLGGLKEGDALAVLKPYMAKGKAQSRLAAISYYYEFGTKETVDAVKPFEQDKQKVPACDEDGDCDWTCIVKANGKEKTEEVKTIGDFVTHCVKPKMLRTDPKKDGDKKKLKKGSKTEGKKDDNK